MTREQIDNITRALERSGEEFDMVEKLMNYGLLSQRETYELMTLSTRNMAEVFARNGWECIAELFEEQDRRGRAELLGIELLKSGTNGAE